MNTKASIIIRTYNEEKHLPALLNSICNQTIGRENIEIIVVDSGSSDDTVNIANSYGAIVVHIEKEKFSFGRSLNVGCAAASNQILVMISGHCIPVLNDWLLNLLTPFSDKTVGYVYGRQVGDLTSRFSERQVFAKYFPDICHVQETDFYCNNANSATRKTLWDADQFDEELTGLEDMHQAKKILKRGYKIAYSSLASVYHLHEETWPQVKRRYEREAIALQHIMPEVHLSAIDFLRYFLSATLHDFSIALSERHFIKHAGEICAYRFFQFWGAYRGNHIHRRLSKRRKELYYFPKKRSL